MKRAIVATLLSIMLSAALLSGIQDLNQFAYYVAFVFNLLDWLILLTGSVKGSAACRMLEHSWLKSISTFIRLGALIFSGHPILAASYCISTVLIVLVALGVKEEKPCKP